MQKTKKPLIQKHYEKLNLIRLFKDDLVIVPCSYKGKPRGALALNQGTRFIPIALLIDSKHIDDFDYVGFETSDVINQIFDDIRKIDPRKTLDEINEHNEGVSLAFNELVDGLLHMEEELDLDIYTGENKSSKEGK
jgi:hypothetical protein|tara:strand:- start:69 stop:476 length:408 start_codon:yes stop_codon:yes gene_type:complete